ncbi:MAG: hypothetical protein M1831_000479 [Alyxoria varia]|nr:MAG: hypothetical protein M1831_000479 [Alyxoria varia]
MHLSTVGLAASFAPVALGAYTIKDDYNPQSFFSMFEFFTEPDPTHGYVKYVDNGTASSSGLAKTENGAAYMGVGDDVEGGRQSVRLTSTQTYDNGLFVIDIEHMPTGCGTWPAFWLVGPDWPNNGEIDILEGVNNQQNNQAALHTGEGCSINQGGEMSGEVKGTTCAVGEGSNEGCPIANAGAYGSTLNQGGGVYATGGSMILGSIPFQNPSQSTDIKPLEWTESEINIWFWSSGSAPSDALGQNPNPKSWGKPAAKFAGCDIKSHFKQMSIVFDTTFCGDWAGATFSQDCPGKGSCESYVAGADMSDAYWSVKALKVYSGNGEDTTPSQVNRIPTPTPTPGGIGGVNSFATFAPPSSTPGAGGVSSSTKYAPPPEPTPSDSPQQPPQQQWQQHQQFQPPEEQTQEQEQQQHQRGPPKWYPHSGSEGGWQKEKRMEHLERHSHRASAKLRRHAPLMQWER